MDWSIADPAPAYPAGVGGSCSAVVRMADVNYRYRRGGASVPVRAHLSLELRHGEILGIFGPNGCGKSSLLNVVVTEMLVGAKYRLGVRAAAAQSTSATPTLYGVILVISTVGLVLNMLLVVLERRIGQWKYSG